MVAMTQCSGYILTKNKLAKARKTRKLPSMLGSKKFWPDKLWVGKFWSLEKYTSEKIYLIEEKIEKVEEKDEKDEETIRKLLDPGECRPK